MLINHLPQTLKTARKAFRGFEAEASTMAMCSKCSMIYEPSDIPPRCTFKEFPTSEQCDTPLLTYRSKRVGDETISVPFPLLPVEVNNFCSLESTVAAETRHRVDLEEIPRAHGTIHQQTDDA